MVEENISETTLNILQYSSIYRASLNSCFSHNTFFQESGTGNREVKKPRTDDPKAIPLSAVDSKQRDEMLQLYKLQMPEDLYHFWDFCKELCPDNPHGILFKLTPYLATIMLMGQTVLVTLKQLFCAQAYKKTWKETLASLLLSKLKVLAGIFNTILLK